MMAPAQFGDLVACAKGSLEIIKDIVRLQPRFNDLAADRALFEAKVRRMCYKDYRVGAGMKPYAANLAVAVAAVAIMKLTGDTPVALAVAVAVLLVLGLKILQQLDLMKTGLEVRDEMIMLHCSNAETVCMIWSSVSNNMEMMKHMIKLFEGVHAELGGPSYPFQDTPEDAALPGAHDAD